MTCSISLITGKEQNQSGQPYAFNSKPLVQYHWLNKYDKKKKAGLV